MDLVPYMFWERQEPGSQLCAQHCINNLLQQHTYNEFDLAEVAQRLDQAENAALSAANQIKTSYNYDDTGFFSISVLERAMEVWDLTLVRWRGEAMKPYQERPEEQAAFILNLASHWFTLRRFSPHEEPDYAASGSSLTKRWYNLNSFLPNGPEWISPTYLRMVLTQAEQEGYSVFCVRKANQGRRQGGDAEEGVGWGDGGVGVLPECEADRIAGVLGEPVGRTGGQGAANAVGASSSRSPLSTINPDQPSVDPVSAPSPPAGQSNSNLPSPPARRRRRQEDLDLGAHDEGDAFAQYHPPRPPRNPARTSSASAAAVAAIDPLDGQTGTFGQEDDDEELDDQEEDYDRIGSHRPYEAAPMDFQFHSRSYDDEDEALQAALKASMDDLPPGWQAPKIEEKTIRRDSSTRATPVQSFTSPPPPVLSPVPTAPPPLAMPLPGHPVARDSPASGSRFKEEVAEDDEPVEQLTADEIRRRRLARFEQ